jgi:hypothetical protein
VLAGSVDFIDAADTTGFIGLGGGAGLAPDASSGDAILPRAGTLSRLGVHAIPNASSGNLILTVEINDAGTPVTCTIVAPATSCSDSVHTAAANAGDRITVLVNNGTGGFVRFVRWTASYS